MNWTPEIERFNFELNDSANLLLTWINHDKASLDKYKARADHNPEAIKIQETRLKELYLVYQKIILGKDGILKCCSTQYEAGKKTGLWLADQNKIKQERGDQTKEAFRNSHNMKRMVLWADHY